MEDKIDTPFPLPPGFLGLTMTIITNARNIRQCKSRFSFIIGHMLAFTSSTNLVREVKNLYPNFKRIA